MANDVTLIIKLQDQVSGKVRAIAGASKKAEAAIQNLQRAVEGVGRKFAVLRSKATAGLNAIATKAKNAAQSVGGFGKAAAIAAAAAGALAGLRFAFVQAGELEKQSRSLKVLTGSLEDAKKIIGELQAFGAVTPFTSAELIETAKRLKAFGFETEKIVDVTKRLADVAGATGADLGGIATAFGQIQAKGRLQGEELLQLQERGIGLQDELQKMYGMTSDEFRKALERGRFSAEAVNLALVKLTSTGGKYAEGAIAQSDTLFGKLSTLQDAFIRLGQNIGKALAPIFKFLIDQTTRLVNAINGIFVRNAAVNAVREREGKGRSRAQLGRYMGSAEGQAAVEAEIARRLTANAPSDKAGLPDPNAKPPKLLQGTSGTSSTSTKVDKEAEALKRQQESAEDLVTSLTRQIELTNELTDAGDRKLKLDHDIADIQKQFPNLKDEERQQLEKLTRELYLAKEGEIARADAAKQAQEAAEAARKAQEADPLFQMQKNFEELIKLENQVAAGATAIGDAFGNSFKAVITGSKSANEALADMMASVAEHFVDMAAKIIAQQITMIIYGTIMKALGVTMGGSSSAPAPKDGAAFQGMNAGTLDSLGGAGPIADPKGLFTPPTLGTPASLSGPFAANGGPAFGGLPMLVGERGPELFVPFANGEITSSESLGAEMANAMAVPFVPGGNQGGTTSQIINRQESIASSRQENTQINRQENLRQLSVPFSRSSEVSMVVAAEQQTAEAISNPAPLDVRFESQSINGVEYVTAEQHQAGMAQAAQRGRALTLAALQNSVKARRRVGL